MVRRTRSAVRSMEMDDTMRSEVSSLGGSIHVHSRSSSFSRLHKRASTFGEAVLSAITQQRIKLAERRTTTINVLCSDLVVSTEFTLERLKVVQETPTVVTVELEDLIERQDQTLFLSARELIICDKRPWISITFMDHLYSEERLGRYLNLKWDLWRLLEADVLKRKVPIIFQVIVDINRGTKVDNVMSSLQKLSVAQQLYSIVFDGALFGVVPWDVPKELYKWCRNGYLSTSFSLKVVFQRSTDEGGEKKDDKKQATKTGDQDEEEEPETVAIGRQRSVRVLGACIARLQGLSDNNKKARELEKAKKEKPTEGETGTDKKRSKSLTRPSESDSPKNQEVPNADGDPSPTGPMERSSSMSDLNDNPPPRDARAQAHSRWNAARPVIKRMSSRKKLIVMRKGLQRMVNEKCEQALHGENGERSRQHRRVGRSSSLDHGPKQERRGRMGKAPIMAGARTPPGRRLRSTSVDDSFSGLLHSNLGRSSRWKPDEIVSSKKRELTSPHGSRHSGRQRPSVSLDECQSLGGGSNRRSSARPSVGLDECQSVGGGSSRRSSARMPSMSLDESFGGRSHMRRSNAMHGESFPILASLGSSRSPLSSSADIAGRRGNLSTKSGPPSRGVSRGRRSSIGMDDSSRRRSSMSMDNSFSRGARRRLPRRSYTMDEASLSSCQKELNSILPSMRRHQTLLGDELTASVDQKPLDAKEDAAGDEEAGDKRMIDTSKNEKKKDECQSQDPVKESPTSIIKESKDDASTSSVHSDGLDCESCAPPFDWAAASASNLHNSCNSLGLADLADSDNDPSASAEETSPKQSAESHSAEACSLPEAGDDKKEQKKKRKKRKEAKKKAQTEALRKSCPNLNVRVTQKMRKKCSSDLKVLSLSSHSPRPRPRKKPIRSKSEHAPMGGSLAPHQFFSNSMSALEIKEFYSSIESDDGGSETYDEDEFALHEMPSFNWETSQQNFNWEIYAMVSDS